MNQLEKFVISAEYEHSEDPQSDLPSYLGYDELDPEIVTLEIDPLDLNIADTVKDLDPDLVTTGVTPEYAEFRTDTIIVVDVTASAYTPEMSQEPEIVEVQLLILETILDTKLDVLEEDDTVDDKILRLLMEILDTDRDPEVPKVIKNLFEGDLRYMKGDTRDAWQAPSEGVLACDCETLLHHLTGAATGYMEVAELADTQEVKELSLQYSPAVVL